MIVPDRATSLARKLRSLNQSWQPRLPNPRAPVLLASLALILATMSAAAATPTATPLDGKTIVSNIHNAPGWTRSHSYTYGTGPYTRVLNGPGWDEASRAYYPGRPLNAYQLISTGSCASDASGGPSGTGSAIPDGTCTWKYLSPVDYITIAGWAHDAPAWKGGVDDFREWVTSDTPLRSYTIESPKGCKSTVAPTGTGAILKGPFFTTSDGCQWRYVNDVIYSSNRSHIPTQRLPGPAHTGKGTYTLDANYEGDLWNDREYVVGEHGEAPAIGLNGHWDLTDGFTWEEGNYWDDGTSVHVPPYHIVLTAAPGESFSDNLRPSDPFKGYDPTKGVAIRSINGPALEIRDYFVDVVGLQIKSMGSSAIQHGWGGAGSVQRSVLEGGSPVDGDNTLTFYGGAQTLIANSLIINHGKLAIWSKYPMSIYHSTIVNPDHVPGSIGVQSFWHWIFPGFTISDTAIFGFTHATAHVIQANMSVDQPAEFWTKESVRNATDASASDGGNLPSPFMAERVSIIPSPLPGGQHGLSMDDVFVSPGSDWRLKRGSPLIGAASRIGNVSMNCPETTRHCASEVIYDDVDAPDILGTARPQGGRYDIGTWQSVYDKADTE